MQLIEVVAAEAEREGSPHQHGMARAVDQLSAGLKPGGGGYDPVPLLRRWIEGDDPTLKQTAARSLARISEGQREYEQAAKWYLQGASGLTGSTAKTHVTARDNLRVHAGRCLRTAGKADEAIELLESFEPQDHTSLNYGYHAVELASAI